MKISFVSLLLLFACLIFSSSLPAQENFNQKEVIYGRKDGMALTMVVLTPKGKTNSKAIINLVSGAGYSGYEDIPKVTKASSIYLNRGYTIFAVMHSSAPKYTLAEVFPDLQRAVRFIRYHAVKYKIDPDHIGITGGSGGAHLSLLVATAGERANLSAKDSVDRVSARVQAVACFFPPTDFLNYGKQGDNKIIDKEFLIKLGVAAPFQFTKWDTISRTYQVITDPKHITAIGRQISPIYHITADDPPTLIIHGDQDNAAPIQQSQTFIKKLKETGVPCELRIKQGEGHGWKDIDVDRQAFADWFDKYLK